ncbi:MAG: RNA polymerase sigma factor [Granulosicoccus sp.]|nr:RNA polymerase sigma factor [Granulosicoccus sp.]
MNASDPPSSSTEGAVCTLPDITRECWSRVLALLTTRLRNLQLAEDMLQNAVLTALETWPKRGVPDNPQSWLYRVAMNRAIDQLRRVQKHPTQPFDVTSENLVPTFSDNLTEYESGIPDERLRMIFTCCHPAIAPEAQMGLTLRTICGLSTGDIARAFLVTESTMAQRLVRVKRKIIHAGIPYEVPDADHLPERLEAVLAVIYLIFNEGYASSSGDRTIRTDLCEEALYLVGELAACLPDEPEVLGLQALMLLHDSRREARVAEDGRPIMLFDQDRSLWNTAKIQQGMHCLHLASQFQVSGVYQLQAAISAVHARAPEASRTHWPAIVALYAELYRLTPNAVVGLNYAQAMSYTRGPAEALRFIRSLPDFDALQNYQPYYAALADLYERLESLDEAISACTRAIELSKNSQEKHYLSDKLAVLTSKVAKH